jgi:tetratricopeptide (TPR) repeat protein
MQHRFWSGIVLAGLVLSAAQTTAVAAEPSEGQSGSQPAWLSRAGARAEPEAIQPLHLLQHKQGFQRAHEILAQTLGQSSSPYPAEVQQWQQQAKALMEQGRYQEAVQFQEKVLAWTEQHLGNDQVYTATSLNNLAELYLNQGAYAKAEPLYLRALAIRERALGPDHPDTATSLNNLGYMYKEQGSYSKAEPLLQRALAIREKIQGPEHPDTAQSLNSLAELYGAQGAYSKSWPLIQRSLAIREKALGSDHPDTAESLNNLAYLYNEQGAYAKAEPLFLRALAIREKALGPDHPNTANILNNLAFLYYNQGAYAKAEPLYIRALAIREKALGPDHPSTATSLNNHAALYDSQGAYPKAEPLYLRALAIREKALGPDHPDTATSLNNLAFLYYNQGAYAKAEPLYIRAKAIFEKALGSNHPITITVRENLEQCRKALGDRGTDFADFTAGRELWFKMTASQAKISSSAEFPHVFIVIMDWRIDNKQTLIAAAADGTSSLYISPGSKVLGGYSAKEEAKAVITAAEKILTLAKKVSDHPLPPPGEVRFYIRTHSGLYMISDSFADLSENKGKTLQLFVAANKLMTVHLDTIDAESKPFYRK